MGDLTTTRRAIRALRREITGAERTWLSAQSIVTLCQFLTARPQWQNIATFLSFPEEIDTTPLHATLWQRGYQLYLPAVLAKNTPLQWRRYTANSPLQRDAAGILTPAPSEALPAGEKIDVVIAPLVAFDPVGTRLGMGGGFYDRTLQDPARPFVIGLAYPCQFVPQLPRRAWDIPLNACACATQLFLF